MNYKCATMAAAFLIISVGCASVEKERMPAEAKASASEARQLYSEGTNCKVTMDSNARRLKINAALEILQKAYADKSLSSQQKTNLKNTYDTYYNTLLDLNDAGLSGNGFCQ